MLLSSFHHDRIESNASKRFGINISLCQEDYEDGFKGTALRESWFDVSSSLLPAVKKLQRINFQNNVRVIEVTIIIKLGLSNLISVINWNCEELKKKFIKVKDVFL